MIILLMMNLVSIHLSKRRLTSFIKLLKPQQRILQWQRNNLDKLKFNVVIVQNVSLSDRVNVLENELILART